MSAWLSSISPKVIAKRFWDVTVNPRVSLLKRTKTWGFINGGIRRYAVVSANYPVRVAATICLIKGALADTFTQRYLEGKRGFVWESDDRRGRQDLRRTAVFALFGAGWCGAGQHFLYNVLFTRLYGATVTARSVIYKVATDMLVVVPAVSFPIWFSTQAVLLDNEPFYFGLRKYSKDWQRCCTSYWSFWAPVQVVVFSIIPTPLRIGFIASSSFLWLVILSSITHARGGSNVITCQSSKRKVQM